MLGIYLQLPSVTTVTHSDIGKVNDAQPQQNTA